MKKNKSLKKLPKVFINKLQKRHKVFEYFTEYILEPKATENLEAMQDEKIYFQKILHIKQMIVYILMYQKIFFMEHYQTS